MLMFDKHSGEVSHNSNQYKLTRYEMALLLFLYENLGKNVSRNAIMYNLYQLEDREPDMKILDVMIHRIRTKLAGSGITVHTIRGFGYRLAIDVPTKVKIVGGVE